VFRKLWFSESAVTLLSHIIHLREILGRGVGVDWMHLAQDNDQWQALVSMGLKFQVSLKA
jgi:hypothetical protein